MGLAQMLSQLTHTAPVQRLKRCLPEKMLRSLQDVIPGYYRFLRFTPPRERFLTVFMDIHNSCNLGCKMCHFGFLGDYPSVPTSISRADFRRFADNVLPHTEEMAFSPCTEPLAHPDISGILDVLAEYRVPKVWMMSNLNLLTRPVAEKLVAMNFHRLLISLDSYKPEVYESIKCKASFARVIENIKMVQELKKASGSEHPKIHFNFVLMKSSVENFDGYMEYIRKLGAEQVGFFHVVVYQGVDAMRGESMWHHKEMYNEFYDKAHADAAKHGIRIERIPDKFTLGEPSAVDLPLPPAAAGPLCRYPWYLLVVYPDGSFKPCEFWFNQKPWGNLITDPFWEVWERPEYKKLRWEVDRRRPSRSCCRNCVSMSDLGGNVNDPGSFREITFE